MPRHDGGINCIKRTVLVFNLMKVFYQEIIWVAVFIAFMIFTVIVLFGCETFAKNTETTRTFNNECEITLADGTHMYCSGDAVRDDTEDADTKSLKAPKGY